MQYCVYSDQPFDSEPRLEPSATHRPPVTLWENDSTKRKGHTLGGASLAFQRAPQKGGAESHAVKN